MKKQVVDTAGVVTLVDMTDAEINTGPTPTLAGVRAAKWERIKLERERRQKAGIHVGTSWFHSDADSRTQQIALVMLGANLPAGLQWRTMDGVFITMTPSLAGQIFGATVAHDQAIFAYAEQLNAAINSTEDPESVDIFAGWPASFGEGA